MILEYSSETLARITDKNTIESPCYGTYENSPDGMFFVDYNQPLVIHMVDYNNLAIYLTKWQ